MDTITQSNPLGKKINIALAVAVSVTLFLFFIDEGYYNFNWMLDVGNWIVFVIYVTLLLVPQLLLITFLMPRKNNQGLIVFKYIVGLIIGITSAFFLLG